MKSKVKKKRWDKPFIVELRKELSQFLVDFTNHYTLKTDKIEQELSLVRANCKYTSDLQENMDLILEKEFSVKDLAEKKWLLDDVFEKIHEIESHSWDIEDEELEKYTSELKEIIVKLCNIKDVETSFGR